MSSLCHFCNKDLQEELDCKYCGAKWAHRKALSEAMNDRPYFANKMLALLKKIKEGDSGSTCEMGYDPSDPSDCPYNRDKKGCKPCKYESDTCEYREEIAAMITEVEGGESDETLPPPRDK